MYIILCHFHSNSRHLLCTDTLLLLAEVVVVVVLVDVRHDIIAIGNPASEDAKGIWWQVTGIHFLNPLFVLAFGRSQAAAFVQVYAQGYIVLSDDLFDNFTISDIIDILLRETYPRCQVDDIIVHEGRPDRHHLVDVGIQLYVARSFAGNHCKGR